MKSLLTITLLLLTLTIACNSPQAKEQEQIRTEGATQNNVIEKKQTEVIKKNKVKKKDPFSNLSPTNGVFHKSDINEDLVLVFDTITSGNYCKWNDIRRDAIRGYYKIDGDFRPQNHKYLRPSFLHIGFKEIPRPMYDIGNKEFLLAMSCEESQTNFTKWTQVAKDSFRFESCLLPNINTKYSCVRILEHIYRGKQLFLINKFNGGEGGENWESIWVCKVDKDKLTDIGTVDIGFIHDDGDWANLTYEVKKNKVNISETRKKMKRVNDKWEELKSTTKLVKSLNLGI